MIGNITVAPHSLLPFSCGLIVIVVGYLKLRKLRKTNQPESVGIFGIWLTGIIGLLLGIFGQVLSMIHTFDKIALEGDISPSIVANGVKSSYKSILVGLAVLIISLIIWGILNGIKKRNIRMMNRG